MAALIPEDLDAVITSKEKVDMKFAMQFSMMDWRNNHSRAEYCTKVEPLKQRYKDNDVSRTDLFDAAGGYFLQVQK